MRLPLMPFWSALFTAVFLLGNGHASLTAGVPPTQSFPGTAVPARPLADAPETEQTALNRFIRSPAWPDRAIALLRLEQFDCAASRRLVMARVHDDSWQVRCFAVRTLARRGETLEPGWLDHESEPRVIRTAVRCRLPYETARLQRGIEVLSRGSLDRRLLAVELAATTDDAMLVRKAKETCKSVIHRMSRAEAGALSPRLTTVTGERRSKRPGQWQRWAMKTGRGMTLNAGWMVGPEGETRNPIAITTMDAASFARLDRYMQDLNGEELDLAVVIDCTASMSGELAEVQGGIDDLMIFLRDVQKSVRVGVVGYRDRREEFETRWWDLTPDVAQARRNLWSLSADGGGDSREAVYPALQAAYMNLTWNPEHRKVLVLIGDGPPHVGYGKRCIEMAARAAVVNLTSHVVQADNREVKHFPAIAEAGGGRCVELASDSQLIGEITGLTVGEVFSTELREFFEVYLRVCR